MALFDPKAEAISNLQKTIDEKNLTITKNYDKIGRLYYGQYKDMNVDVTTDINTCCEAVSKLIDEIKDCEKRILFEKGLKLCPNCHKENNLEYAFCFACGAKFGTKEEELHASVATPVVAETPVVEASETPVTPKEN